MSIKPTRLAYLEVDEVPGVTEFVDGIRNSPVPEQLRSIADFIKSQLKNACSPANENLPDAERVKVEEAKKCRPKKLSEAVTLGYGACVEYSTFAAAILDKLGITYEFQVGQIPQGGARHAYLDVQIDGQWKLLDIFARVYLADIGKPEQRQLDPGYYTSSKSKKSKSV